MTDLLPKLSRRSILMLVAGAGIGLSPVGFDSDPVTGKLRFGPAMAMADSGSDDNEPDEPDEPEEPEDPDKPEDPEDNSGPGGGDDNGGDDNGGEGGGDVNGGGGDTDGEDGNTGGGDAQIGDQSVTPASGSGRNQLRNVTVRYPDGWVELILNDQYQLIDNLNRQVILRPATVEDFNRMVALGS